MSQLQGMFLHGADLRHLLASQMQLIPVARRQSDVRLHLSISMTAHVSNAGDIMA
jgi:hypothetical protein